MSVKNNPHTPVKFQFFSYANPESVFHQYQQLSQQQRRQFLLLVLGDRRKLIINGEEHEQQHRDRWGWWDRIVDFFRVE